MQHTDLMTANKAKQESEELRELEVNATINKIVCGIKRNIAQGYGAYRATLTGRQYGLACDFIHRYLEGELGYRINVGLGGVLISWD